MRGRTCHVLAAALVRDVKHAVSARLSDNREAAGDRTNERATPCVVSVLAEDLEAPRDPPRVKPAALLKGNG
jgi:hypothetical protein